MSDLVDLLETLVRIDSVNPDLVAGGAGEAEIARVVAQWCEHAGLHTELLDAAPGRPMVVATRKGTGDGPTLLLTGHLDTVGVGGMPKPHEPRIDGDRLTGRGAYDMKAGVAAAMDALAQLPPLRGDVVFAGVPDEEAGAIGTQALVAQGRRFDAAILTEPTDLTVGIAHKGFVTFEIETQGRAAHGSRPQDGIDAIALMGPVLTRLSAYGERLATGDAHPLLGTGSLHASIIEGGHEMSSYPAHCKLTGEVRTLPGLDPGPELKAVAGDATWRTTWIGHPFEVDPAQPIVRLVTEHSDGEQVGLAYWTDAAHLGGAGIPTVVFGPAGAGAHADDEWVDLPSVHKVRDVLMAAARDFCAG